MRIAVATDDGQTIASHTGRCERFLVFDFDRGHLVGRGVRENRHTAHAQGECTGGEHGHAEGHGGGHGSLLEALGDCHVLIARGMGPRLRRDLAARGIEAAVCAETDAQRAAELFVQGELTAAGTGACHHG